MQCLQVGKAGLGAQLVQVCGFSGLQGFQIQGVYRVESVKFGLGCARGHRTRVEARP